MRIFASLKRSAKRRYAAFEKEPLKYSDVNLKLRLMKIFPFTGIPLMMIQKNNRILIRNLIWSRHLQVFRPRTWIEYFGWKEDSESGNDEKNGVVEGTKIKSRDSVN